MYDFVTKAWKSHKPNIKIPKIDSHSAVVCGSKMYIYGGYIPEKATSMSDVLAFDF
jgi:hypothetical protein